MHVRMEGQEEQLLTATHDGRPDQACCCSKAVREPPEKTGMQHIGRQVS